MINERLKEKAIVVIGGGSGIGAECARRVAAEGANVCVADINLDAAKKIADGIVGNGGRAFSLPIDIADETSVNDTIAAAADKLGGIDGAHVNAADLRVIYEDTDILAEELRVFDRTIAVNLRGHALCTRALLPHLLAGDGGAIVYSSSGASVSGDPTRPAYSSSKAGLEALMRHVASRWGREAVTANCVAPGVVITPEAQASGNIPQDFLDEHSARVRNKRLGRVQDLAAVVALLLSEEGRWINGQVFHINGGAQMR